LHCGIASATIRASDGAFVRPGRQGQRPSIQFVI
jgi:hypothetical protein